MGAIVCVRVRVWACRWHTYKTTLEVDWVIHRRYLRGFTVTTTNSGIFTSEHAIRIRPARSGTLWILHVHGPPCLHDFHVFFEKSAWRPINSIRVGILAYWIPDERIPLNFPRNWLFAFYICVSAASDGCRNDPLIVFLLLVGSYSNKLFKLHISLVYKNQ